MATMIPQRARVLSTGRMSATSKRLAFLEKLTAEGGAPTRSRGTASRWSTGRSSAATTRLATFTTLRASDPDYVAMYLMCGQMLEKLGRTDDAREWLEAGIERRATKRDTHALGELEARSRRSAATESAVRSSTSASVARRRGCASRALIRASSPRSVGS